MNNLLGSNGVSTARTERRRPPHAKLLDRALDWVVAFHKHVSKNVVFRVARGLAVTLSLFMWAVSAGAYNFAACVLGVAVAVLSVPAVYLLALAVDAITALVLAIDSRVRSENR